jgi:serralysin
MDMAIHYGTNADELIDFTTNAASQYGLGDDRVVGRGGNDWIATGAGNDFLDGGDGVFNTYLDGDGDDTVLGGTGEDRVHVDAGNDIYYGEGGIDTLFFDTIHHGIDGYRDNYQGVRIDLAVTKAQDFGQLGVDRFFGFEDVYGSFGNDAIFGTNGSNGLDGFYGNDALYGRGGNDILNGDRGADTIVGGLGQDTMYTGDSLVDNQRDIVRYESLKDSGTTASTRDVISEFKHGLDKIDLSKLDANPSLKGNQAFKVVKGFTKALGEIKLIYSGPDTLVQIDGDKDAAVDMTILVVGTHLSKVDFIL